MTRRIRRWSSLVEAWRLTEAIPVGLGLTIPAGTRVTVTMPDDDGIRWIQEQGTGILLEAGIPDSDWDVFRDRFLEADTS